MITPARRRILRRCGLVIAIILVLGLSGELILRYVFGFCDAVLMQADPDYEYIAQPNQNRFRFRNRIIYNSFSMRSEEVRSDAHKILLLGDSVVNGGHLTSHEQLASTLLSKRLSLLTGGDVQVLNISAGSWGPDNCAAYLRKHGTFDAEAIVLVVSSHDAQDVMTFSPIVGISTSCPDRQYKLACWELYDRYLKTNVRLFLQRVFSRKKTTGDISYHELHINEAHGELNPGISLIAQIARDKNIPFMIYLHAERSELQAGQYNSQGQQIIRFAEQYQIPICKNLELGLNDKWYLHDDFIHLSHFGQQKMADILFDMLRVEIHQ